MIINFMQLLVNNLFFSIKDSLPKDFPAQSGVLPCDFPVTL